ncbi:MAG: hypothetical protein JRJ29_00455 [Deltaproteobacteria bacterium]|nr:hypothetical protein [Deltaproteobacteria bacterium]MBW2081639.1 hypothetical protein [Deltaproteobacteria bacterium]
MPIFVYECRNCGDVKETYVSSTDTNYRPCCLKCKVPMDRVVAAPGLIYMDGKRRLKTTL